jgi:hypothetical protein
VAGGISSNDSISCFDCDVVGNVSLQHPLMDHQPSLLDGIKCFFGLDKKSKMTAPSNYIELKTKCVVLTKAPIFLAVLTSLGTIMH